MWGCQGAAPSLHTVNTAHSARSCPATFSKRHVSHPRARHRLVSEWSVEHAPGTAAEADALKSLSRSSLGATDQSSKDAPRGLVASVLMTLL